MPKNPVKIIKLLSKLTYMEIIQGGFFAFFYPIFIGFLYALLLMIEKAIKYFENLLKLDSHLTLIFI
jgi:hypothetical protein